MRKIPPEPMVDPVASALLHLGKAIHDSSATSFRPGKYGQADTAPDVDKAVNDLLQMTAAKPLLTYHCKKANEMEVQVLALTLYLWAMLDGHPTVRWVSELVGRENPEAVLQARAAIRGLCEKKMLLFRNGTDKIWNGYVIPSPAVITICGLAGSNSPFFSEVSFTKTAAGQDTDGEKPVSDAAPGYILPRFAFALETRIRERLKGDYLDNAIRSISSIFAIHLHRAKMIRENRHPKTQNLVALLIGSSSVGKTFLCDTAARCVNELYGGDNIVPFSSVSATDLTAEGYVGLSPTEDVLKPLILQCNGDVAKARYGCCFIDEIDKKVIHGARGDLDVGGRSVQEGILKMVGGTMVIVGGRRNSFEKSLSFNSDGTMFLLAGAFTGLDELLSKNRNGKGKIGFAGEVERHESSRLRDCLIEYGLLPELVGRVGSVIQIPSPRLGDLVDICTSPGGLLTCYQSLWTGMGMSVAVSEDAVREMAAYGLETRGYARSCQSVFNRITEQLVSDDKKGVVAVGGKEIRTVIESMGAAG